MEMRFAATCMWIAVGLAAAPVADAQTLYKLIDKNGKVTYAEKPPKDFDGTVIRLDIDPNANTATLPKPSAQPATGAAPRAEPEDRVKAAREKLEAARKAYEQAVSNPGDEDLTFIGNKGGGTRPVPTEAYTKRLAVLEQAVKDAEEELKRAQGG